MVIKHNAVVSRFPEFGEIILNKIKENDDFESLCSDYELCMEMLTALKKETESKNFKLEEYMEIKKELEAEVLKYLH
jgi:hypothetical protein